MNIDRKEAARRSVALQCGNRRDTRIGPSLAHCAFDPRLNPRLGCLSHARDFTGSSASCATRVITAGESGVSAHLVLARAFDMELVKEAMDQRSQQQAGDADNREAAVERVKRREEFARSGSNRIDGTHAAENHRRVEQRVNPRQPLEKMVAARAERERTREDRARGLAPSRETPHKEMARQQALMSPFEAHRMSLYDRA
jgi:hypothetical protein